jgi:hypothetical protein
LIDLPSLKQSIDIYNVQLCHFGQEVELFFKPFNILKIVMKDECEQLPNDNLTFAQVNDDPYLHINIDNAEALEAACEQVQQWFKSLSLSMNEGIMIKPRKAFLPNMPPAFKVRNDAYLTMIYGINFLNEYDRNLKRRNISEKLKSSIHDWTINLALLKVKYSNISTENYYFKNIVYDRIMGEHIENKLDPRL